MQTIYVDFETYYSSKKKYSLSSISVVEYVHHPEFYVQGMGIKIDQEETKWVTGKDVERVLYDIDWSNSRVVGHNVKFDGTILAWKYGICPAQWVDTKAIVKAVLGNSIPTASLKDAAEALELASKGELRTNNIKELTKEQEKELAQYCIRDVDLCHDIFKALMKYIPGKQWYFIDWTVRAFLEPQLGIDKQKCQNVYNSILSSKQKLLDQIGIDKKVFASNLQFPALLEKEGYKVPMKINKKGKKIPALSIQDEEFLSGAQQTHRFSGGNGCAGNPQNFKRGSGLREAIIAPKGKTLIVADLNKIELRILAYLSKDTKLMRDVAEKDPYKNFASLIYEKDVDKITKNERWIGKAAVLGLGYGMGWKRFMKQVYTTTGIVIDEKLSKSVVKLYRNEYAGVVKFWNVCEVILAQLSRSPQYCPGIQFLKLKQNAITLPDGLDIKYNKLRSKWIQIFGRWKKEWTYSRYKSQKKQIDDVKIYGGMVTENLCQGLAGVVCKEGILRLIEADYPPAGMVHDELLVVCEKNEESKVKELVRKAMTDPMSWWPELPLDVEIGTGTNWLEAK
jgi:hypothetical protein